MVEDFYPFKDVRGENIDFDKLTYEKIIEIIEFEEGYKIEFKGDFSKATQEKISRTLCSFANSSGGWAFYGIEDKSKKILKIDKPKGEIELNILNKIEKHVSPNISSLVKVKFCEDLNDLGKGIVVIKVLEGNNPPYLSKGAIYVRNGASSLPIGAERPTVDYLLKKRDLNSILVIKSCFQNALHSDLKFNENLIEKFYDKCINEKKEEILTLLRDLERTTFSKTEDIIDLKKTDDSVSEIFKNLNEPLQKLTEPLAIFKDEEINLNDYIPNSFTIIQNYIFKIKEGINIKNVFDLGNLKIYKKTDFGSLCKTYDEVGDQQEIEKLKKIEKTCSLIQEIKGLEGNKLVFINKKMISLVLCNEGVKFDEDIKIELIFPKNIVVNLSNIILNDKTNKEDKQLLNYLKLNFYNGLNDFDNYIQTIYPQPPYVFNLSNSYYDYENSIYIRECIESEIEALYSNYEIQSLTSEYDILKINFKKILPGEVKKFPVPIFLNKVVEEIKYNIKSKHTSIVLSQTLK